jgi:hypothetical protein
LQKTLKIPKKRLSLRLLLYTKPGIEATLAFIKETKIATRQWRLERAQEEEKEEEEEKTIISFIFAFFHYSFISLFSWLRLLKALRLGLDPLCPQKQILT